MDKEIKTGKKHLIRGIVDYVSERKWALALCVYAVLGLVLIVLIIFPMFLFVWVALGLLIWLFVGFYGAYSMGVDEGYEIAENPRQKTIEIRDTWPSHIFHACITLISLLFVIFFFPWFIVYRLGKWKGRKKYWALDKEWKEENAKRVEISEQRKYTYEYYDNPNGHTPNDYGYTGTDEQ
jgi:cellulose synthase/poly-beta-1,6-N-acetylglucosamine synthase-like glycosyltransferase